MLNMVPDFALSSGGILTLGNYFLIGWFNGEIDKFYMQSWNGISPKKHSVLQVID
jgi:hypothetical protein